MGMNFRNANELDSFRLSAFLSIQWAVQYAKRFDMRDLSLLSDQMHGVARIQRDMTDPKAQTILVEENGLIVAALEYRDSGDGVLRISNLFVERCVQRQGLARRLVEMARDQFGDTFGQAWLTYCDVEADNKEAQAFFSEMGLELSGESRKVELGGKMVEIVVMAQCTRSAEEFADSMNALIEQRKSA